MITIEQEPTILVGLMSGVEELSFDLNGEFRSADGVAFAAGSYRAYVTRTTSGPGVVVVDAAGQQCGEGPAWILIPQNVASSFTLRGVTIGIDFHWQRKEDQQFRGALRLKPDARGHLTVINEIGVEGYLTSVISSEMSAAADPELLKSHAVISRSWLLAQLEPWKPDRPQVSRTVESSGDPQQLIRWYDRENHTDFDVCADDHCQRYQGITKATDRAVFEAIRATRGQVLVHADELCDTRFSKCCGGMMEEYRAAWEDLPVPYLRARYDGESFPAGFTLPLSDEVNATRWILGSPPAFCHTTDPAVLARILPNFDQETADFYRWRVSVGQEELQARLRDKLGIELGPILRLEAVERGASGRLVRLRLVGERDSLVIGKELEIRRALSPSHLYSSAFVVEAEEIQASVPSRFTLRGAGWGHGVGLCQIGAALMAERGYPFAQILAHYYADSRLHALYPGAAGVVLSA